MKPEKPSELQKWFDRITIVAARVEPLTFENVDVHVARDELRRMQFMVEHGLGPNDMLDDRL